MSTVWPDMALPPINLWSAPRMHTKKRIHWHCKGQMIHASRGGLTASVSCPVHGASTNARAWRELFVQALWLAEMRLDLEEHKHRV